MTVEEMKTRIRVTCADSERRFSYTFSDIDPSAESGQVYALGQALNSVQEVAAKTMTMTTESMLNLVEG